MKILYVDDEPLLRKSVGRLLERSFEVEVASDGFEALDRIRQVDFDVVVTDINMPGMSGVELHGRVSEIHPHLGEKFIFVSGASLPCGLPNKFLAKPFDIAALNLAISELHDRVSQTVSQVGRWEEAVS